MLIQRAASKILLLKLRKKIFFFYLGKNVARNLGMISGDQQEQFPINSIRFYTLNL